MVMYLFALLPQNRQFGHSQANKGFPGSFGALSVFGCWFWRADCSYDKVSPNFISLLLVWRVLLNQLTGMIRENSKLDGSCVNAAL